MIKKKDLSKEDIKTWESYLKNPSDIYDKDKNNSTKQERKDRFRFDLHGYSLSQANLKVKEIIMSCSEKNYSEILLITGKGLHSNTDKNYFVSKDLSKLKFSIPDFITSSKEFNKLISSIDVAEEKDGGEGAVIIKLKKL